VYFLFKRRGQRIVNYSLSGVLFGLAALARPAALLLPLVLIFIPDFGNRPGCQRPRARAVKQMFKKFLIVITAMVLIVIPWSLRNYRVHKKFVAVNTVFGPVLLASYFYPDTGFGFTNHELQAKLDEDLGNEVEQSEVLVRYVISNVAKRPFKFIKLLPLKFLWFWEPFGGTEYGLGSSYNIVYGLSFLFFLFGLFGSRKVWRDALPLYVAIGYFVMVSLVFFGSRRYRMQAEPFIIILASYGVFWAAARWKRNKLLRLALITGVIVNVLFLFLADNIKAFSKKTAGVFEYNAFSEYTVEGKQ